MRSDMVSGGYEILALRLSVSVYVQWLGELTRLRSSSVSSPKVKGSCTPASWIITASRAPYMGERRLYRSSIFVIVLVGFIIHLLHTYCVEP
eukprot:SAG31_NODE_29498_length_394_cov_0.972881_1_plen_91_part_10